MGARSRMRSPAASDGAASCDGRPHTSFGSHSGSDFGPPHGPTPASVSASAATGTSSAPPPASSATSRRNPSSGRAGPMPSNVPPAPLLARRHDPFGQVTHVDVLDRLVRRGRYDGPATPAEPVGPVAEAVAAVAGTGDQAGPDHERPLTHGHPRAPSSAAASPSIAAGGVQVRAALRRRPRAAARPAARPAAADRRVVGVDVDRGHERPVPRLRAEHGERVGHPRVGDRRHVHDGVERGVGQRGQPVGRVSVHRDQRRAVGHLTGRATSGARHVVPPGHALRRHGPAQERVRPVRVVA